MKYSILKQIVLYLKKFKKIKFIKRVDNNTILIDFFEDKIFFDLTKSNSLIYKNKDFINKIEFNAPFDMVLRKRFSNVVIKDIYLRNDDKILCIDVFSRSSYKKDILTLQLEFTGKITNIIILDKNIVIEALRHIDSTKSTRVVKVGEELRELEKKEFNFKDIKIDDIDFYLEDVFLKKQKKELDNIKKQKINKINKQISKLKSILDTILDESVLLEKSNYYYNLANFMLANIYKIKPFSIFEDIDFNGKKIKVDLTNVKDINSYIQKLFKLAKKYKQKAKFSYLEKDNLNSKIVFLNRLLKAINSAKSIDEVEFLYPKKQKNKQKTKKENPYASFFIDGYKILVGRSEKENIYLLENSKANYCWFHLKDRVSSHVIVVNDKKTLPEHIIYEAAKLCVKFSVDTSGKYEVDYTKRKNVKIQNKANVLYNPYKTIVIPI